MVAILILISMISYSPCTAHLPIVPIALRNTSVTCVVLGCDCRIGLYAAKVFAPLFRCMSAVWFIGGGGAVWRRCVWVRRWIFGFQPSELLKIGVPMMIAFIFTIWVMFRVTAMEGVWRSKSAVCHTFC